MQYASQKYDMTLAKDGYQEVDAILTVKGVSVGIELKAGATMKKEWSKTLVKMIDDGAISHGFIVYTGDRLIPLSNGVTLLPISNLMCFD